MNSPASSAGRKRGSVPTLKSRLLVAAPSIRPGMFVTELDLPWSETPFLVQGFLVDQAEHLQVLRELCLEVVIDPRRSATASLGELIDLYDITEEEAAPPEPEVQVRVRYIDQHAILTTGTPSSPWLNLARLKETVTRGFQSLASGSGRERHSVAATPKHAEPSAPLALPRFSRADIRYASVPENGKRSTSRASNIAWQRRGSRQDRRKPVKDDASFRSRLIQFDDIVESLNTGWSGLLGGLSALGRLTRARPLARLNGVRRRPLSHRKAKQLHIPKVIELVVYRDRSDIEGEVDGAREAITMAEDTLARLRADSLREAALRVDGLPDVADAMVASVSRNSDAMIWLARVRSRDATAYSHSIKVTSYLLALGRQLGFPKGELSQLALIGLLMDVGKLDLDPALINKREALSDIEFAVLQRHVGIGLERLSASMELEPAVRAGIAQHHEWIDGSGYPNALKGDAIGIFGRMAAIADMYAALTTDRPYAPTLSSYDALQLMYARANRQLHGPLVEQFVRAIGLYPVGSLVLLSTEEVAVVTALDKVQRLEPRVLVLTDPHKITLERPYEIDLLRKPADEHGKTIRILRSLPAGVHNIDFRNYYIA